MRKNTRKGHAQVGPVVPLRLGKISTQSLHENLVLVEFQDDVRQPPVLFSLNTVAITGRLACRGRGIEGFLDDIGHCDAWWEGKAASCIRQEVRSTSRVELSSH